MEKHNTKVEFITAFWKLYEKKQIDRISIREICELAGYNRTTFYVHYQNIFDLLDKSIDSLFIPIKNNLTNILDFQNIFDDHSIEKIFLNFFKTEDAYIELLFKRGHYYILSEKVRSEFLLVLKDKFKINQVDNQTLEYIIEYQISAVFGVIKYWFQTNKQLSENELIEMIYNISTQGSLTLITQTIHNSKGPHM